MSDSVLDADQQASFQAVMSVYESHKDELAAINQRLAELRSLFQTTFNENDIEAIFCEVEDNGEEMYYTTEFDTLTDAARGYGLGFSHEGYYLWKPSTQSC